ncbi:hypothetical protein AALO_G00276240 [Alosa alosa]|uniref:Uncharacterized protein n=1 Tax=Alosa alosa TaxID=278164 RepID=A0AAV6FIB3_9TELE|nr:hypothetical protein AALO_G00276240 [Alosa alosa]
MSFSCLEQPAQANFSNICTGLEILCFLLTVLQPAGVLALQKSLQRHSACMTSGNTKVLLARTSNVASKHEELECLYAAVGKVIYEGLTNYEKATSANPTQLFGTLMILKSACSYNSSYIDRLISVFMRSLQKMVLNNASALNSAYKDPRETSTESSAPCVSSSSCRISPYLATACPPPSPRLLRTIASSSCD